MIVEALVCLALNVYHEARGEPVEGREAVAHVVMNRVASPNFPDTVCGVVLQGGEVRNRCQFSWYCDGRLDRPSDPEAWKDSWFMAQQVLAGAPDPTGGAVYYHAKSVRPWWADKFEVTATIGDHIFYRGAVR